jgi:ABC-2 type transport system ATP-binding protein
MVTLRPTTIADAVRSAIGSPIIEIHGLVKRYDSFAAVDGVDLVVFENEIFGILGPNGAGKTTTLEMVEGLRKPDSGAIRVAGIDAVAEPTAVKRVIGVQLQTTALFDYLTVRELIVLFAAMYGGRTDAERVDELIRQVALQEKADSYADRLSGGQRQRLSIALALVNNPAILFLDEPTTGLDPQARRNIWDLVRELRDDGKTVVLTTHYMEEAQTLCDRVAVMDHGRVIACDSPAALIQTLDEAATVRARLVHEIDRSRLDQLPGIRRVDLLDGQLELHTDDVSATLAALLRLADEVGVPLDDLSTTRATLEDVFLAYTGRSLRE